jgi:hypothetical protein
MCNKITAVVAIKELLVIVTGMHRGTVKSLARSGMKQATATENFDVHISN